MSAERSTPISPKHLVCICGNDTFIDVRQITTQGGTVRFVDVTVCERCKRKASK